MPEELRKIRTPPEFKKVTPSLPAIDFSKIDLTGIDINPIIAAGKPTPRITKNWLARVFDESGQVVNAWAIKNRTEFEALVDANAVADGSIKYAVVELGSIEAIELVDFILKKNGVGGKASYAIGPIDIPGTTDRFIVLTTVAEDADPIAVQNATSQAHDNSLSLMTSKSLGLI